MDHITISFEVAENPGREPIIKYRKDGAIEIVFQLTQEQMDEVTLKYIKKRAK